MDFVADSVHVQLHRVHMGEYFYVSEVYAASIFRMEVCGLAIIPF
jgi:hypothetical protein